jgi:hypothetical protein
VLVPELVPLLRSRGREAEAKQLVRRHLAMKQTAPRHRALRDAIQHALAGRKEAALASLEIAHRHRWWASPPMLDHPYNRMIFDTLRREPKFRALVRDYDAWVERERAEAARELKAAGLEPFRSTPPPAAHDTL